MGRGKPPVIVASMGRSGSTLLYKSICNIIGYSTRHSQFKSDLSECDYRSNTVYKTHDFPPNNTPDNAKFIWTFADPYEVVISVIQQEEKKGIEWIKGHFDNLHGEFEKYRDLYVYDAMRLEEHFDKWYQEQKFDLATVKYREMWNYQHELSQFIGNYIDLPEKNLRDKRLGDMEEEIIYKMTDTYDRLYTKFDNAEDYKEF